MECRFVYLGKSYKVNVDRQGHLYLVSIENNKPLTVELLGSTPNCFSFTTDGKMITTYITQEDGKTYVFVDGKSFVFELEKAKSTQRTVSTQIVSPMPGTLVKLLVAQGDKVEAGQTLAIVEAMKMENELKASVDGVVKRVNFAEGAQVDTLQPIVELEDGN
ncbi:MAG: biotin/lipoyl-binding protein [bacterium]|nr:biotin/lipoyl-binding protein [bacterium]